MKVIFIANEKRLVDASRMYRCNNQAVQLNNYGWETIIFDQFNIELNHIRVANIIIFQRCVFTERILEVYNIAKSLGILILADFDDLLFLPSKMKDAGGIRSKIITNMQSTQETSLNRFTIIPLADYIMVSTDELSKQIELTGSKTIVSKNSINDKIISPDYKINKGRLKKILYMSGTRTHNADFMLMHEDILQFMREFKDVELTILGEVDVPVELKNLKNTFIYDKVAYDELFPFISQHDLSLVPLEDTLFNDAKSSLKFYESGYVSVPVLSSPVREFREDIEHGVNGYLVENNNWYEQLKKIYLNEKQLEIVKINCCKYVLNKYTVSSRKDYLKVILNDLWLEHNKTSEETDK